MMFQTSTEPQDRFLEVRGARLHYLDWGGEGPPALLLHATGFHAHLWDPIARSLSPRFHVYALDARGHGDSDKPESGYDWQEFIADVIAFMDTLGLRGALGVGHSLGGTITAGVAAERPDLYERIVLLEMVLFPDELRGLPESKNPIAAAARRRREVWSSRQEIFESYRRRPPFDTWREEALRLYIGHGTESLPDGTVRLKCPGRIESQVFGMGPAVDGWSMLERIDVPALLVRGEHSNSFPEQAATRALRNLRRGQQATAPGTTHFVPMERPEWVVEEIDRFLRKQDRDVRTT